MKNGLIFDLDGTLVDSLPGIVQALNLALEEIGISPKSTEYVRRRVGNGARELVARSLEPGAEAALIDATTASYLKHYAQVWQNGSRVFDGIPEVLQKLHAAGHGLAVLSNKTHEFTVEMVRHFFPETPFTQVQGFVAPGPRKPDPAAALQISQIFNLAPKACVFIGDSTIDIETGNRAGMHTLAVTWGYHDSGDLLAARPDHMADSPQDLADFLA